MLTAVVLLAQLVAPGPATPGTGADTLTFPPAPTVVRLYTDCDEDRWPWGTEETLVPKTIEEIAGGVARRQGLEALWRTWYAERGGDSMPFTGEDQWAYPLAQRARLLDNYRSPRPGGIHGALDIFVRREGVEVRAPVNGVVVASGDGWRGGYRRRGGLYYEGGGLSRRAGNALILFEPGSGAYFLFSHLWEGLRVRTGDVVRRGQPLGRVGHTGNAAEPGHGRHLHLAYKTPGNGCGVEGVLVSTDPYQHVRAARARRGGR